MTALIDSVWELVKIGADRSDCKSVSLDEAAFSVFKTNFKSLEKDILENYMHKDIDFLDRHKIAAIIIVALIQAEPLKVKGLSEDKIFIGNENLAVQIGLSYMQHELNLLLEKKGFTHKISRYVMPEAMSCKTSYLDIICRNLYNTKECKDWGLNPLDLAERLFLLEYITLKDAGIEPVALRDSNS